ncbi:hypothetical protein ACL9RF_07350 [Sphingobacterium sp. Mn56C]|uniref:hypothetical protein n=1 Tax=Sphingobacterium sp. Mn56C TaxID=3395261 RepID=UPI003BDAF32E
MKFFKKIGLTMLALSIGLSLINCQPRHAVKEKVKNSDLVLKTEDATRFKEELESINATNKVSVHIPDSARIVYANEQDILNLTHGIVLLGWPSCPWFRNAIETLLEFAQEKKAAIYYLNIHDIRDIKEIGEHGEVVTTKAGSPGYEAILAKFNDILNPYTAVGVDSIKRISSPTVLFIEDGKAVHKVVSTVVSQTNPAVKLDAAQREELKQRYDAYFTDEFSNHE